jgi:pimeloyl-ACP methyl ester carboxylesterase
MPDGRRVAVDDRGDPAGRVVLFFHGTPDTRLGRHPDDGVATASGVRLVAADRPGLGGSDPDAGATPASVADDHAAVLDHLGVDRVSVIAWSAGAIPALAFAGRHAPRLERLTLVAPLVPADAYASPEVLASVDVQRRQFVDALPDASAEELGRELAPWLVPALLDEPSARDFLRDSLEAVADLEGAGHVLVASLLDSVRSGLSGLEREITSQATPLGELLGSPAGRGSIHVGADDTTTPPPMSRWLGDRLGLPVHVHPGEGHMLALTRWAALLSDGAGRELEGQAQSRSCEPPESAHGI